MPKLCRLMAGAICLVAVSVQYAAAQPAIKTSASKSVDRGRYLVKISGCNDCHTPGYAQTGGKVPESKWLIGDQLGWRGPWGTTYPSNLRLYMSNLTESQWVKLAKVSQFRPPMPWFALRDMNEQDLRALYKFIKYLGPAGEPAPSFVLADQEPKGPFVLFPQPPK